MHDPRGRLRIRGELLCIETEDGEVGGRVSEVRHPRAHEVEDVALHIEFVVERADRRDRRGVDVGDEPRERVELGVLLLVLAGEEAGRVLAHCGCSMSSSTSPSGPAKQTKRRTGRPGPIAIATGGEIVSTPSAASSRARMIEITDEQRQPPHAERVRGAWRRRDDHRRTEADEDEVHFAATRCREHHFVERGRSVDVQVRGVGRRGREAGDLGEAERAIERE